MSAHLVYIQMTPSQEDLSPDPESLADNDPVDQDGYCPKATTLLERKKSSLGSFWKALSFRVCFILVVLVLAGVILWLFLWTPSQVSQTPQIWKGSGTTSNFSNILLQRCFSYVRTRGSELRHKDCHQILEAFLSAFLSKNPCEVTEQDYAQLLQLTEQKIPCNQVLLWSKTKDLVNRYRKYRKDLYLLENSILGVMIEDLTWCGDPATSVINYVSCPDPKKDCRQNAVSVLWDVASKRFAESACGVVHVLLNGSITTAFNKSSIFGSMEVPNLDPKKVHKLKVSVMYSDNVMARYKEPCSSSSIEDLKTILSEKNIEFTCQ